MQTITQNTETENRLTVTRVERGGNVRGISGGKGKGVEEQV